MVAVGALATARQQVPSRHKAARRSTNIVIVTHGRGRQRPKPRVSRMVRVWHGGKRMRRGLRARARGSVGHEPRRMPIELSGTNAPPIAVVMMLAVVHGGWCRWRLAVVTLLGD
ncbi:hypothetical protein Dimus_001495 [Dionaea muscipula]